MFCFVCVMYVVCVHVHMYIATHGVNLHVKSVTDVSVLLSLSVFLTEFGFS